MPEAVGPAGLAVLRVSEEREHAFRKNVNGCFGIVNTNFGNVNTCFGRV
ncbi:MAG: hypothetical protein IT186_07925 [Acidobacteria bacterium]|nr:hypothetical protein [Acidobacteriota bacterium]